ncbi:hypothetical protein OG762_06975 [Streptomyces sp. NBC_01136]|uniref:hypothetical protein n=1 Tax=unclassified Streptomyces TaxID=2593676 RepID=UPI00324C5279|nr:hypothetical protein OG762_06975 [Streptomyces sp. NBC_01136]
MLDPFDASETDTLGRQFVLVAEELSRGGSFRRMRLAKHADTDKEIACKGKMRGANAIAG